MSKSVLVTHPNRQHSHQLAQVLHTHERLSAYWTGVPARPLGQGTWWRSVGRLLEKHALLDLPEDKVAQNIVGPVARRMAALVPASWGVAVQHAGMAWFDCWCARRLDSTNACAVVAYENAALHTFRAAKVRGMVTILDAASFHHAWQDAAYDYPESEAVHQWINTRKDKEIAQADHILTVSDLARESYIEGGVAPDRVTSVPVGCDLKRFQKMEETAAEADAPFTFIFAGHAGHRKGIDLLIEAVQRLHRELDPETQSIQIWIAGGEDTGIEWGNASWIERLGRLPQPELARRFQEADCLVLPSRHDSFGMVVVEAMATGLPAIVTENVGAKQVITEGESGWVIPAEDVGALYDRMRWCIGHAKEVQSMASSAHTAAQEYTWDRYRNRVVSFLEGYLEGA